MLGPASVADIGDFARTEPAAGDTLLAFREFEASKQEACDEFLRANLSIFAMVALSSAIFPTCQTVFEWSTNCRKFDETVSIN